MRTAASALLDGGYEEILRLTLVQIAQILLKGGAARTVHDLTSFSGHLQGRAEQMVDEELSAVLLAIEKLSGSVALNRSVCCRVFHVSVQLLSVEMLLTTGPRLTRRCRPFF